MLKIDTINHKISKKKALKLIILLGLISLFGDIIYEGARSINGPFLGLLGANAVIVGLIVGLGEFLGYGIRLISGFFSDKTKAYWFFTLIGYGLLFTVPLLSLVGIWQIAGIFIISERIGKAIRVPARDTIISHATKEIGTGFGFGIHEFLDQIGAIIGPLVFVLFFQFIGTTTKTISDYQIGYSFLWLPYIVLMILVLFAYFFVKKTKKQKLNKLNNEKETEKLSKTFWLYLFFSFITTIGFVNFVLIAYHLKVNNILSDAQIPLFYVIAMIVDAIIALIIGKIYDKLKDKSKNNKAGLLTLIIIPLFSFFIPFLAFSTNYFFILISVIIWGIVMGSHETIMRSAIADITPINKRGTGYGIFTTSYGLAFFIGSILVGFLYDYSLNLLIVSIMIIEIIAIPFFFIMWKTCK
ncbi:MAG: MFS transporter [Candidatus Thermoplasmatota archaeon]|jgi:MFS family permease|nr:MFS transporter [Candidatus Thermoplasmatota archaeon]